MKTTVRAANASAPASNKIRAGTAVGVLPGIAAAGAPVEPVLAAAGLSLEDITLDRMVDAERIARLYEAAARATGDPCFGLHAGTTYDLSALGALSYAVLNAPTVAVALANFERYGRAHMTGGRIAVERRGGEAELVYDMALADRALARQVAEGAAVVGIKLIRHLVGADWWPRRVHFAHARPRDLAEHTRLLGATIRFDAAAMVSLVFAARDLDRAVATADRGLLPIVERHLDELLAAAGDDADFLATVRNAVAEVVCDGAPTIQTIAKRLGASVRTLQRRLGEHGAVFKDVVADTRRELALRYLGQGTAELTEIAFLLGYSELSAFDRAFRRWTGETPQAARKRLTAAS